jgi:branched-chain amino acid transport system permease protein
MQRTRLRVSRQWMWSRWSGRGGRVWLTRIELALLALGLIAPWFLSDFHTGFATRVLILGLLVISLDLAWGFGGVFSLGQAALFGWGAYVSGLLSTRWDIASGFIVLPAAALTGMALSVALGLFLFAGRRGVSEIYIAMTTLTLSYASERIAASWTAIGAANGIPSIPVLTWSIPGVWSSGMLPGTSFYYFAAACLVSVYLAARYFVRSQLGLVLAAARSNEERATFLGYRTSLYKMVSFVAGGSVAGLAGGLYAFHEGFVSPSLTGVLLSTQVVLWLLVGGATTLVGGIIGVVVIEYAALELSDRFQTAWQIFLGVILVAVITFLPQGLIGLVVSDEARGETFGDAAREPHELQEPSSEHSIASGH